MQNTPFSTNKTLNINGRIIDLTIPRVMGIVNLTEDSFYDGGRYLDEYVMLGHVEKMVSEGVDFIDVGAQSTRPGAAEIGVKAEQTRVVKAITLIHSRFPDATISVDTYNSEVADAAVAAGASMINDVSGGNLDAKMFQVVARLGVPYILMHMRGTPETMQSQTQYDHVVRDIITYFHKKVNELRQLGVKDLIVDPGFGFAKTVGQNFALLRQLEQLTILQKPILVGLSRKSMIWKTLASDAQSALNGTTALNTIALMKGANILRVHDVKEARELIKLFASLQAILPA